MKNNEKKNERIPSHFVDHPCVQDSQDWVMMMIRIMCTVKKRQPITAATPPISRKGGCEKNNCRSVATRCIQCFQTTSINTTGRNWKSLSTFFLLFLLLLLPSSSLIF